MHKFKNPLIAFAGLTLLTIAIIFGNPNSSFSTPVPDGKEVQVVNTPSNPVPTVPLGIATVAGNVSVTGSVGISPAGNTVKVENSATPLLVRDVGTAPVRQAFVYYGAQTLPAGQFDIAAPAFNVPPGKRCVIEYITLEVQPPGYVASVYLQAPFGPAQINYNLLTSHDEPPFIGRVVRQQVKIYAEGQTQLMFRRLIGPGGAAPETVFGFVLSGYLEAIE